MNKIILCIIGLLVVVGCTQKNSNLNMPNPASVYCEEQGGTLEIVTEEEGQKGICTLKDGTQCDEWAYFRGECPVNKHVCTDEEKAAEICTMEYLPVCGDDGVTYGNKCSACASKKINYWVLGECPEDKTGFAVVKKQTFSCSVDDDCELPGVYAMQSNCPYNMKCIDDKCTVICPYPFGENYDTLHPNADKECDECPQLTPPSPSFCTGGTIVEGITNECGCKGAPRCDYSVCTEEAKICPDGSTVARDPKNNCEFPECPSTEKTYILEDPEQCKVVKFVCANGNRPFFDDKGCGCEPESTGKLKATDCTPEQRDKPCTREFLPVCGWFDSTKIQCFTYPCAQTYDNKCVACSDEKVISWTEGECPKVGE